MNKRLFCCLLISLLLLIGCGKGDDIENSGSVENEGYPIYELSTTEILPLSGCYDSYSVGTQTYLAGVDTAGAAVIVTYDAETRTYSQRGVNDFSETVQIAAEGTGVLWLLDDQTLTKLSPEGAPVSQTVTLDGKVLDMAIRNETDLIVLTKKGVAVLDGNGNVTEMLPNPDDVKLASLVPLSSGQVLCQSGEAGEANYTSCYAVESKLEAVLSAGGVPQNDYQLMPATWSGYDAMMPSTISGGSCAVVYGVNLDQGSRTPLFDTAGLNLLEHLESISFSGNQLHLICSGNSACACYILSPTEARKQLLTIGRIGETDGDISAAIAEFNAQSRDYYVQNQRYNADGGEFQLRMDMLEGTAPDILPISYVDYPIYVSQGLLTDLTPYLEQDRTLSNDLQPSILSAVRDGQEALYYLPISYQLYAAYAPAELVTGTNWTTSDFQNLLAEYPNRNVLGALSPWMKVQVFLSYDMVSFVDYQTMTCSFDTQDFCDYLEYLKRICTMEFSGDAETLLQGTSFNTLRQYKEFMQATGGRYALLGYPSDHGNGIYASAIQAFGIVKGTGHEQAAWEFIAYLLSQDYQETCYGFPVRTSALESRIAAVRDEFPGEQVQNMTPQQMLQIAQGNAVGNGTVSTSNTLDGLTAGEEAEFRTLISKIDLIQFGRDTENISIIYEEITPYFTGEKNAQEVAKIIQNRFSIYLSEQG